jgi:hypothetical protein
MEGRLPISMRQIHTRDTGLLIFVFLLLAAPGCADLSAITEFASTSARSAQFTKLVTDYLESPLRQKRYQPVSNAARLDSMAKRREAQGPVLLTRIAVIGKYMKALGKLASDEAVDYDESIEKVGEGSVEAKLIDESDADALTAVSRLILRLSTEGWRRNKLKELITEANPSFQRVVLSLKTIVNDDFADDLEVERDVIDHYYVTLIDVSHDSAGIEALREWEEVRMSELDARQKALKGYSKVLAVIAAGHQKLYDQRDDLAKDEVQREMKIYAKDLQESFNAVRKGL